MLLCTFERRSYEIHSYEVEAVHFTNHLPSRTTVDQMHGNRF